MAMLTIAALRTMKKLPKDALLICSWAKNRTSKPSAPWTPQIAATVAQHLSSVNNLRAGTAILLKFAAMLRPSELFSITWEDILFPGDLRLQPYGPTTAGLLVRNPKTAKHIAQKQFVPVACPATITLIMNLRACSNLSLSVFHDLDYASYRSVFISAMKFFELSVTKITLHGARGAPPS